MRGLYRLLTRWWTAFALAASLARSIQQGERRLQTWLISVGCNDVPLAAPLVRNINRAEEL